MIHVSIHAGRLDEVSRNNRQDWLDIGYEKLDAAADYKIVAFSVGEGATPPMTLKSYPRWSASLWDLVARSIALSRSGDPANPQEQLPVIASGGRRCAFATAVSAVIEHHPTRGTAGRRLASMEIVKHKRTRGVYRATVEEDLQPPSSTIPFLFTPAFLRPAELVLHAALVHLQGNALALPPRPARAGHRS